VNKFQIIACKFIGLMVWNIVALPSYSQFASPSLATLSRCSDVVSFYTSSEQWRIATHEACVPTPHGGRYIYYSATKGNRLILWTSEGGNGIRTYIVRSVNLEDGSYIESEAFLGIRGEGGSINSMEIVNRYGSHAIPINNILTVLEWERASYAASNSDTPDSSSPQSQQMTATGTLVSQAGSRINLRDWAGMNAPIRHQASPGDAVTVWESRTVAEYVWYRVTLFGSNASGWVRSDVIRVQI